MDFIVWIWLGLLVLFIVFELITTSLTTIWFAGGALVAFVMALVELPVWAQIAAFFVVSIVLLIFTRPFLTKFLKVVGEKTNVDSLIGQTARVIVDINNNDSIGYALVGGQEWTARAENDNDIIPKDTLVEIVGVSGVKLIVRRKEEKI